MAGGKSQVDCGGGRWVSPWLGKPCRRAINMARLLQLPLDVLHVIQLRKAGYFAFIDRHLQEDQEAYAKKVLEEAVQRAEKAGVEARTHLLEGEKDPSGAIIDFLEEARGVKFLVLGSSRPWLCRPASPGLHHRTGDPGSGPPGPAGAGAGGAVHQAGGRARAQQGEMNPAADPVWAATRNRTRGEPG